MLTELAKHKKKGGSLFSDKPIVIQVSGDRRITYSPIGYRCERCASEIYLGIEDVSNTSKPKPNENRQAAYRHVHCKCRWQSRYPGFAENGQGVDLVLAAMVARDGGVAPTSINTWREARPSRRLLQWAYRYSVA
jgi:hypothetical protein